MSRFTFCNCPAGFSADPERHAPDCPGRSGAGKPARQDAPAATLSPAHIEDGEEVEVVGTLIIGEQGWDNAIELNPGPVMALADAHPKSVMPLMTVAQHQRIVAARASKAAARVEDEREACERWIRQRSEMPAHIPMDWDVPFNRYTWAAWSARAALSAPPAAGVPDSAYARRIIEAGEKLYNELRQWLATESDPDSQAALQEWREICAPTPPASEQQHDGRMPSDSRNRMWELIDAALLGTVPDGLKRGDICNILAPLFASEQQRAEADLLNMIDQHRIELLPEYDAGYTAIAYCAQTEPIAEAVAMTARAALEELAKKLQSAAPPQENDR